MKKTKTIITVIGASVLLFLYGNNTGNILKKENNNDNDLEGIKIGTQTWSAKNLDVSTFRNGNPIPEAITNEEWEKAGKQGKPVWCYYNNDPKNGKIYGKLYNWYAVNDKRGLAPEGWHVPTDAEWATLITYLGGKDVAGGKLKETDTTHWQSPNTWATNESGFSALSGGYRGTTDGSFGNLGDYGFFWSATEYASSYAWYRILYYDYAGVGRYLNSRTYGLSVRCLKD